VKSTGIQIWATYCTLAQTTLAVSARISEAIKMSTSALRDSSKNVVQSLGYQFNENLPSLDDVRIQRDETEVIGRILCVYVSVACSYGFSKEQATSWLQRESLTKFLTEAETDFLNGSSESYKTAIQWQVEALWALSWACGYHDELDFSVSCPDAFIGLFPDLKSGQSSSEFRYRCKIRSSDEIAEMLDLSYCLHWAVRNSGLTDRPQNANGKVEPRVIEERRRSFEWLVSDDDWESVSLDT